MLRVCIIARVLLDDVERSTADRLRAGRSEEDSSEGDGVAGGVARMVLMNPMADTFVNDLACLRTFTPSTSNDLSPTSLVRLTLPKK